MASLPFKHPKGCTYALFNEIFMEDRGRKEFGDITGLSKSIKILGLIQPPLCVPVDPTDAEKYEGKKYRLVAGERRTHAMNLLNPSHIPINLRHDVKDEGTLLELEIEENFRRKDMLWQEFCTLLARAHIHHSAVNAGKSASWGSEQTGALFGKSATHVSHALHVYPYITAGDEEIMKATSITDAYNILLRRHENEVDAERTRRIFAKKKAKPLPHAHAAGTAPTPNLPSTPTATPRASVIGGDEDLDAVFGTGPIDSTVQGESSTPTGTPALLAGRTEIPLSSWISFGDSLQLMSNWEDSSIDLICTDPPYGIDIDDDHLVNITEIQATHDREQNLAMFPVMMQEFYRVLKDRTYCCIWHDIEHNGLLRQLARDAGFKIQNHPFYWVKTHACKNQSPGTNFTNTIECCLILRKGTASLEIKGPKNSIIADGSIARKQYSNPFAKPYEVWKELIIACSRPGDIVADPFAGEMSCPLAALNLGREIRAIEIDQNRYNKGIVNLSKLVKELAGDSVSIT